MEGVESFEASAVFTERSLEWGEGEKREEFGRWDDGTPYSQETNSRTHFILLRNAGSPYSVWIGYGVTLWTLYSKNTRADTVVFGVGGGIRG